MKNRKCPNHKACWDYGDCESCELGRAITKLHKRIDRLKKKLEKAENERKPTADLVEVVRCKDCAYAFMSITGNSVLYCDMRPSDDHLELNKNYFCADGERKKEASNEKKAAN